MDDLIKKFIFILILFISIGSAIAVPDPGHSASAVGAGTFPSGDFVFQDNLTASLFKGMFNWGIYPGISTLYFDFNQTHLQLNESKLNATIDARDSDTTYSEDSDYLTLSGTVFGFDENELNTSISNKLATTYYNLTASIAIAGTITGGNLANTGHSDGEYDSISFNITEDAGSPALDLRMNFTGLTTFSQGIMRYKTSEPLFGDTPVIQLWSYEESKWEDYPLVAESERWTVLVQQVFDADDHIQNGTVQMRLYKSSNGNTNNDYFIDWIAISRGVGTPTGEEQDPLAIHRDNINTTQMHLNGLLHINTTWLDSIDDDTQNDTDYYVTDLEVSGTTTKTIEIVIGDEAIANISTTFTDLVNHTDNYEADTNCSASNSCPDIVYESELDYTTDTNESTRVGELILSNTSLDNRIDILESAGYITNDFYWGINTSIFVNQTNVLGIDLSFFTDIFYDTEADLTNLLDDNYQPLEATLTDIADGTIAEDLDNTANPWDDNEVSDTLTVIGYMQDEDINTFAELTAWVTDATLLKSGGTLTSSKWCQYDGTGIDCNVEPVTDTDTHISTIESANVTQGTFAIGNFAFQNNLSIGEGLSISYLSINNSVTGSPIKIESDNQNSGAMFYSYGLSGNKFPFLSGRSARGTLASPTASNESDIIMRFGGAGYGTSFPALNRASIDFKTSEQWTGSNQGTKIEFSTTENGTTNLKKRMTILDDGTVTIEGDILTRKYSLSNTTIDNIYEETWNGTCVVKEFVWGAKDVWCP